MATTSTSTMMRARERDGRQGGWWGFDRRGENDAVVKLRGSR